MIFKGKSISKTLAAVVVIIIIIIAGVGVISDREYYSNIVLNSITIIIETLTQEKHCR